MIEKDFKTLLPDFVAGSGENREEIMNQIIMNMETNMSPAKVPVIVPLAYQAMVCLQEKINQANSMVVKSTKGNSKREEDRIPLWNRYSLSIPEAAKYFGIGETRIYQIVAEHPGRILFWKLAAMLRSREFCLNDFWMLPAVCKVRNIAER